MFEIIEYFLACLFFGAAICIVIGSAFTRYYDAPRTPWPKTTFWHIIECASYVFVIFLLIRGMGTI